MRAEDLTLHLQQRAGMPGSLSNGAEITRDLAALINSSQVVPADLGLFSDPALGQTWEVKDDQK
jgi:hypothetical protein